MPPYQKNVKKVFLHIDTHYNPIDIINFNY
jgi:hypothetical protein